MREAGEDLKLSIDQVGLMLTTIYRVPKKLWHDIRLALTQDSIMQGDNVRYDRIYSSVGLMLREEFGFGQERIVRGLKTFDRICGSVLEEDGPGWGDLMEKLRKETGIIVRTGDDKTRLICEVCEPKKEK